MTEIRHIRDDEIAARAALSAEAFGFPVAPTAEQQFRERFDLDWTFGAFEAGLLVAALHIEPMRVRLGGGWLPMAGVQGVGALPEVRRRGHVGRLLSAALAQMRDRGLVVSMLFPTFYALYRRYGWELAASERAYRFDSHELQKADLPVAGAFERLTPEDWPALDEVYRAAATRNGMLERDGEWWRHRVIMGRDEKPRDIVLWRDDAGTAGGYVIYGRGHNDFYFERERGVNQLAGHELTVRELIATSDAAYLQMLRYLSGHDLARRVLWTAPLDDPLLLVAPDPRAIGAEVRSSFMLRVIDVPGALQARGAPPGAPITFTLGVRDPRCTWNDGAWRVETDRSGACSVQRATGEPGVTLDVGALAALLTGQLDLATARALGRATVRDEAAMTAVAAFFATQRAPHCSDFF